MEESDHFAVVVSWKKKKLAKSLIATLPTQCNNQESMPTSPHHISLLLPSPELQLDPREKHLISLKSPHNQNNGIIQSWMELVVFMKKLKLKKKKIYAVKINYETEREVFTLVYEKVKKK